MSKKTKRVILRVDDHTFMQLEELSNKQNIGISVIVRAFISKVLNEITDECGHLTSTDD